MAGSETAKRTVISNCKYQSLARVFQHDEAKRAVGRYIRTGVGDTASLISKAVELRARLTDTDFERSELDINADYITQFANVAAALDLPVAEITAPGNPSPLDINGVRVKPQIEFRLSRTTRTNKILIGAGTLRYAKGKALRGEVAAWQSAFIHGYLRETAVATDASPDPKLCLTIDAFSGECHQAPTDSVRRFRNMEAACATIAERWENIKPPSGAVL
jgi:hypothetical protein